MACLRSERSLREGIAAGVDCDGVAAALGLGNDCIEHVCAPAVEPFEVSGVVWVEVLLHGGQSFANYKAYLSYGKAPN